MAVNVKRYAHPRKLSRSMEKAGHYKPLPILVPKAEPLAEKIEVKPLPVATKIKEAFRGFKAKLARVFRATKGR